MWALHKLFGCCHRNTGSWLAVSHDLTQGYAYTLDFQLHDLVQAPPGPVPFKYLLCAFNATTQVYGPCYYQGVLMSYPNGHLLIGYHPGWAGKGAVLIQPASPKGVRAVTVYPHKLQ